MSEEKNDNEKEEENEEEEEGDEAIVLEADRVTPWNAAHASPPPPPKRVNYSKATLHSPLHCVWHEGRLLTHVA